MNRLPHFDRIVVYERPLADAMAREAQWLGEAARSASALARLWQGEPGWVVPQRTTALAAWPEVRARHGAALQVRASGGGLVPQGPGLWNLSLAWPAGGATPAGLHAIYAALCGALAAAFARLGVGATPQPVAGSFCDGRWNLASRGRKFVGTAQAWRRAGGAQVVLAHAVIVVDADPAALTERANALESELGQGRPYDAGALTSLALEAPDTARLEARMIEALAWQLSRGAAPAQI